MVAKSSKIHVIILFNSITDTSCLNIIFSSCSQRKSLKCLEIFGFLNSEGIDILKKELPDTTINKSFYSSIARPVGSMYLGKIWDVQCKD